MKLLVAVIKPFKLQACLTALRAVGVHEVLHSEARGYGRQKDHLSDYRDDRYAVSFLPKIRLELAVPPEQLKAAVEAVIQACRTGRQGDGKIWVLEAREVLQEAEV
jgi:nitrogen regulatory protein P-II 2